MSKGSSTPEILLGASFHTASAESSLPGALTASARRRDYWSLVEGDKRLFNQYGLMIVSPQKHPHVKAAEAQKFVDWLTSPAGQQAIAGYKIGGEQLFFPNAATAN